jgi:hypothetical protein
VSIQQFATPQDALTHYGVKGQRWGVRNEDKLKGSENSGTEDPGKKSYKKAVIIAGSVVGVAAIAAGAYYVAKRYNVPVPKEVLAEAAKAVVEEPKSLIWSARGKNVGYKILQKGGLKDPEMQFLKAGHDGAKFAKELVRFGDRNEKIAATFADPEGRKDRAGRGILHDVILPEAMSIGIETIQQVQAKVWPMVKDEFEEYYNRIGREG